MHKVEHSTLIEGYVTPLIQHPVSQAAAFVVTEVVKIVAAKIFLEMLVKHCLRESAKLPLKDIRMIVVLGPVIEEIIFRGIVLNTIHGIQMGWNKIQKKELTQAEEKTEQVFRVHLNAFIFAAAHLHNGHTHVIAALAQCTICYIGGVSYGYLTEKYKTLSVSILAHGWGNMLVVMVQLGYLYPPICIPALAINEYVTYLWATKDVNEQVQLKLDGFGI